MAHIRSRHAEAQFVKLRSFWPVVGVLGPRQCGKTTFLKRITGASPLSLDDLELREEAKQSPRSFLGRLEKPICLDEVQKAPELFDAIKLSVDRRRQPGQFFITGSTTFSAKLGIRESLTGRIGTIEMHPMTWAELNEKPMKNIDLEQPQLKTPIRVTVEAIARSRGLGGMPVPAFTRDSSQRDMYWKGWLETALLRDLRPFVGRSYDPDLAMKLLLQMGKVASEGELPSLKHFSQPARTIRKYFQGMEDLFLLRRITCHAAGKGQDVWLPFDSGCLVHLMGDEAGVGAQLSLTRTYLWNEWAAQASYAGKRFTRTYFKSTTGSPVDLVVNNTLYRIVGTAADATKRFSIECRPLLGAMKTLKVERAFLIAPVQQVRAPTKSEPVGILPIGFFC